MSQGPHPHPHMLQKPGRQPEPPTIAFPRQQAAPQYPSASHYQHYVPQPSAPPAPKPAAKKWPWIVGGLAVLLVLGAIIGPHQPAPTTALPTIAAQPLAAIPTPTSAAPTSPPVVKDVRLPAVVGRNGGIVYDQLQKLGLTNVQMATHDAHHSVVVLPQNWTVTAIEPRAGTTVRSDQLVVVTMTKP